MNAIILLTAMIGQVDVPMPEIPLAPQATVDAQITELRSEIMTMQVELNKWKLHTKNLRAVLIETQEYIARKHGTNLVSVPMNSTDIHNDMLSATRDGPEAGQSSYNPRAVSLPPGATYATGIPPMILLPGKHWKSPAGVSTHDWLLSRGVARCAMRGMTEAELRIAMDNLVNHGDPNLNAKFTRDNLPPAYQPQGATRITNAPAIYQQAEPIYRATSFYRTVPIYRTPSRSLFSQSYYGNSMTGGSFFQGVGGAACTT